MLSICISFYSFLFCLRLLRASWPQPQVSSGRRQQEVGKEKVQVLSVHFFRRALPRERLGNIPLASRLPSAASHSVAAWPGPALAWISLTRHDIPWVAMEPVQYALADASAADVTRLVDTCPAHIHSSYLAFSSPALHFPSKLAVVCRVKSRSSAEEKPDYKTSLSLSH